MPKKSVSSYNKRVFFSAVGATLVGLMVIAQTVTVYAWQLDVDLTRSTFGSERVCASVEGPYGYDKSRCTDSGPNAGVSFNVPENEVPVGYNYKVCAWGGIVSFVLKNCKFFEHDRGDESVWMSVGG